VVVNNDFWSHYLHTCDPPVLKYKEGMAHAFCKSPGKTFVFLLSFINVPKHRNQISHVTKCAIKCVDIGKISRKTIPNLIWWLIMYIFIYCKFLWTPLYVHDFINQCCTNCICVKLVNSFTISLNYIYIYSSKKEMLHIPKLGFKLV
jgi:hypothetical protein